MDREALGRLVRETWVKWASEQPDLKPSWLVGWDDLDAGQREADCRIGQAVAAAVRERIAADIEASIVPPKCRYERECRCLEGEKCHPHACHDAMNKVSAECEVIEDDDGLEVWPVIRHGMLWNELDPLIRQDAANIARHGPPPRKPQEEGTEGE